MMWQAIQRVAGLNHTTPMMDVIAPSPPSRAHRSAHMTSSQEHTSGPAAWIRTLPGLDDYLSRQSECTQRLLEALDHGIRDEGL